MGNIEDIAFARTIQDITVGSSDQLRREAGIAWKELMENNRIAVPVIYRGIVTNLFKLTEVKQQPFYTFSEAVGQKCTQAQQGRLSRPHLGRLDGWKAGSSGSFFTARLAPGRGCCDCRQVVSMQPPHVAWAFQSTEAEF